MSSVEAQFLESEDFAQFEGEWIAILDKKVVAHGKTFSEVYEQVQDKKIARTPLYHRIPQKDEVDTFIL
jgi:hypothetical protein